MCEILHGPGKVNELLHRWYPHAIKALFEGQIFWSFVVRIGQLSVRVLGRYSIVSFQLIRYNKYRKRGNKNVYWVFDNTLVLSLLMLLQVTTSNADTFWGATYLYYIECEGRFYVTACDVHESFEIMLLLEPYLFIRNTKINSFAVFWNGWIQIQ